MQKEEPLPRILRISYCTCFFSNSCVSYNRRKYCYWFRYSGDTVFYILKLVRTQSLANSDIKKVSLIIHLVYRIL